jgi:hypothetical protein
MAPEADPKPYDQNQKRIVDNLPETRLEGGVCCLLVLNSVTSTPQWIRQPEAAWGNHYITSDPEWVRSKGAEGSKTGRGRCSVCWRFWKFDRRVPTICPVCKVHLCADGCFLVFE